MVHDWPRHQLLWRQGLHGLDDFKVKVAHNVTRSSEAREAREAVAFWVDFGA
jgi:hypothetical protein